MKKRWLMINKYTVMAIVAGTMFFQSVSGQYVSDFKKTADTYYAKGDYYSAAVYYEKYLNPEGSVGGGGEPYTIQKKGAGGKSSSADMSSQEVIYRIAESYRKLNDYQKAEKWYAEAAKFDKSKYPEAQYWYAVTLRYNANYDEAAQQFNEFLASHKKNDNFTEQSKMELANIKFIKEQLAKKDLNLYKVNRQAANGEGATYAGFQTANGLVFTSTRSDGAAATTDNKKKSPYVNNIYQQVNGSVEKLNVPNTDDMEQGVASFSADGNKMYFTRWTNVGGKNVAAIYASDKQADAWSTPVKLNASVNMEGHSAKQPFVTADGKYLVFSSDRPGGKGKYDLWYAALNNGEPGKATNLAALNTKENDEAPFYHAPSGTLVFASNGRVGMGGFDLYESKGNFGSSWAEPANLGFPVNTHKDDIYFYNDGSQQLLKNAGISSDRSSECCLELYTVNKTYRKYVTGVVTDCKTNEPLSGVSLQFNNGSIAGLTTSANGRYTIELETFTPVNLSASKSDYNNAALSFFKPDTDVDTLYNPAVCLVPVEVKVEEPVVETEEPKKKDLKAYFDFAKYDIRPETYKLLDTLAGLLNRESMLGLEIYGYTDKVGTDDYNKELSRRRAEACKKYLESKGIASNRLKIDAKGECCPLQPETVNGKDNPAGRQANRRVEFNIIVIR